MQLNELCDQSIAVDGKNWMFVGSNNRDTAAGIYSLIENAKMNNINPHLQKVLATIQDYNDTKTADLIPWNIIL